MMWPLRRNMRAVPGSPSMIRTPDFRSISNMVRMLDRPIAVSTPRSAGDVHEVAGLAQDGRRHPGNPGVVVDDQDASFRCRGRSQAPPRPVDQYRQALVSVLVDLTIPAPVTPLTLLRFWPGRALLFRTFASRSIAWSSGRSPAALEAGIECAAAR